MADIIKIDCPYCEARQNAERKNPFFDMPRRWIIINALLVIFTGFWIAFLFGWYFHKERINICLVCKNRVDDAYIAND